MLGKGDGFLAYRAGSTNLEALGESFRVSLVQLFVKMHNEKVEFQKAKCLVKTVKKCFLKKLSV